MSSEIRIAIRSDPDILTARQSVRELAASMGESRTEQTLLASAVSELSRNIITYARRGEITLKLVTQDGREGILIIASDDGPGIADVSLAMQDGFSTSRSLGLGLPGAKRLMDEFDISSELGKGTTITMTKWGR